MKNREPITDEIREEARIRPDRNDRFEAVMARGEVLSDGRNAKDLFGNIENNG